MANILVLDDVVDAAHLTKRILVESGHRVAAFTDEDEALDFIRANKVDLAILDIRLKRLTGVEVLAKLKKIRPETRVMMLTGYPTIETAQESLQLGASEYCVKPIDTAELEEKVAKILQLRS